MENTKLKKEERDKLTFDKPVDFDKKSKAVKDKIAQIINLF